MMSSAITETDGRKSQKQQQQRETSSPSFLFSVTIRDTMHTITEWAKDPVLDNGNLAPCGGEEHTINQTISSEYNSHRNNATLASSPPQQQRVLSTSIPANTATSVSAIKSAMKKSTTIAENNANGYVVDSGRSNTNNTSNTSNTNGTNGTIGTNGTNDINGTNNHNSDTESSSTAASFLVEAFSKCSPAIVYFSQVGLGSVHGSGSDKNMSNNDSRSGNHTSPYNQNHPSGPSSTSNSNKLDSFLFSCSKGAAMCSSLDEANLNNNASYGTNDNYNYLSGGDRYYAELEQNQLRRLASWGTYATTGTEGTADNYYSMNGGIGLSPVSSTATSSILIPDQAYDDDGNPIDAKLIERAKKHRQKKIRKRVVHFDYPPITSLRQCPRMDPDDIPRLFFSEEELDMYEDDRRSTFTVDDVEIVAISTSLSEDADPVVSGAGSSSHYSTNTSNHSRNNSNHSRNNSSNHSRNQQSAASEGATTPKASRASPAISSPTTAGQSATSLRRTPTGVGGVGGTGGGSSNAGNTPLASPSPRNGNGLFSFGTSATIDGGDGVGGSSTPVLDGFRNYVSTPRNSNNKGYRGGSGGAGTVTAVPESNTQPQASNGKHHHVTSGEFPFDEEKSEFSGGGGGGGGGTGFPSGVSTSSSVNNPHHPSSTTAAPVLKSNSSSISNANTAASLPVARPKEKRLLRSVQIYLRERSTGL